MKLSNSVKKILRPISEALKASTGFSNSPQIQIERGPRVASLLPLPVLVVDAIDIDSIVSLPFYSSLSCSSSPVFSASDVTAPKETFVGVIANSETAGIVAGHAFELTGSNALPLISSTTSEHLEDVQHSISPTGEISVECIDGHADVKSSPKTSPVIPEHVKTNDSLLSSSSLSPIIPGHGVTVSTPMSFTSMLSDATWTIPTPPVPSIQLVPFTSVTDLMWEFQKGTAILSAENASLREKFRLLEELYREKNEQYIRLQELVSHLEAKVEDLEENNKELYNADKINVRLLNSLGSGFIHNRFKATRDPHWMLIPTPSRGCISAIDRPRRHLDFCTPHEKEERLRQDAAWKVIDSGTVSERFGFLSLPRSNLLT